MRGHNGWPKQNGETRITRPHRRDLNSDGESTIQVKERYDITIKLWLSEWYGQCGKFNYRKRKERLREKKLIKSYRKYTAEQ